jgi:hypothetical protein
MEDVFQKYGYVMGKTIVEMVVMKRIALKEHLFPPAVVESLNVCQAVLAFLKIGDVMVISIVLTNRMNLIVN